MSVHKPTAMNSDFSSFESKFETGDISKHETSCSNVSDLYSRNINYPAFEKKVAGLNESLGLDQNTRNSRVHPNKKLRLYNTIVL